MTDSVQGDVLWQTAVGWVMREHDQQLDAGTREVLFDWLARDPAHRAVYEEASLIWLLTGLVPPVGDERSSPVSCQDGRLG